MTSLPVMTRRSIVLPLTALLMCAFLVGCAVPRAYLGEPLNRVTSDQGYRGELVLSARPKDDVLMIVSLSGGGMRASTMAYGLLEQLAADRVPHDGGSVRLIDEMDVLSAVSGGAIPAAYYTLYGDRLFEDFSSRFLERNVTSSLRRKILFDPRSWWRLSSSEYSRGDFYADYLDRRLFRGATFADLDRSGKRPFLIIHATDVALAGRFEFTQDSFDSLCTDLNGYPLARAVAASSSVPAVFTPITVRNHAGRCGYEMPPWVDESLSNGDHSSRTHFRASIAKARNDSAQFAYIHLVDGALSDNLGVRTMLDALNDRGSFLDLAFDGKLPQRVVYVMLNAGDPQISRIAARRDAPDALEMLRLMGTVPVDRYSAESKALLRETLGRWAAERGASLYFVDLEIESLRTDPRYSTLVELPTTLALDTDTSRKLRCATRALLHQSADYRRLLGDLEGVMGRQTGC